MSVFSLEELQKMNKNELITIIGNYISDQEIWLNKVAGLEKEINKQKVEIERLAERNNQLEESINKTPVLEVENIRLQEENSKLRVEIVSTLNENAELQKQVDELKMEKARAMRGCEWLSDCQSQAVKDAAPLAIQRFINQLDIDEIIRVDSDLGKELLKEKEFVLKRYYGVEV